MCRRGAGAGGGYAPVTYGCVQACHVPCVQAYMCVTRAGAGGGFAPGVCPRESVQARMSLSLSLSLSNWARALKSERASEREREREEGEEGSER